MKKLFHPSILSFSLLIAEAWAPVYRQEMKKQLGVNIPSLFVFKDKKGHYLFRPISEQNLFVKGVKKYFLKDRTGFLLALQQYVKTVKHFNTLTRTKSLKDLTTDEIWKLIEKTLDYTQKILPFYVALHYICNYKETWINFKESGKEIKGAWLLSEGYYDKADNFIKRCVANRIPTPYLRYYKVLCKKELKNLLSNKKADLIRLERREEKDYLIKGHTIFDKDVDLQDYLKKHSYSFREYETKNIKQLHGQVVVKGKVKGIARVIINNRNLRQIKTGDILITPMTSPNFTPYIKKVKAIVTDYGGILCHAAIMAREFHIPCVIDTKIATKLFKNGDWIEVDANKGVVKKI